MQDELKGKNKLQIFYGRDVKGNLVIKNIVLTNQQLLEMFNFGKEKIKIEDYNVCICCDSTYEKYKIGEESERWSSWLEWGIDKEPKGLCNHCNPKSIIWFVKELKCHLV